MPLSLTCSTHQPQYRHFISDLDLNLILVITLLVVFPPILHPLFNLFYRITLVFHAPPVPPAPLLQCMYY